MRAEGYVVVIKVHERRWRALLDAALEQPHPTPELIAAIEGLKRKKSGWRVGRPKEKHNVAARSV